ncbi:MAG: hypothetical protein L0H83_07755 [Salinisphaera sp.]|nr:hypothetical protein [Salinisphaera sp.]
MRISIDQFAALVPKLAPEKLGERQAQTADNVRLLAGVLECWLSETQELLLTQAGTLTTAYLFEDQYWFAWTQDVDVVKGPIPDDTSARTYFTGTDQPRWTDNTLALTGGGTAYPIASRTLGIPAPAAAPTVAVTGVSAETDPSLKDTRSYVYTYVSDIGEEGPPSPASALVSPFPDQAVKVDYVAAPAGQYVISNIRIYRTSSSGSVTDFQFVVQVANGTSNYSDSIDASLLGEVLPSEDWIAPPTGMIGLVALPNGILAGFDGNDICICEQYLPHAWPTAYKHTTSEDVVGLAAVDNALVVLTDKVPYLITGSSPATMTMTKIEGAEQACVAKRSIDILPGYGCVYASPDGLIAISGAGVRNLTKEYLARREWQALTPTSIIGVVHEGRYFGFYGSGADQQCFVFDPDEGGGAFYHLVFVSDDVQGAYRDAQTDTLYLLRDTNELWSWATEAGTTFANFKWRSKVFVLPRPAAFSCGQVRANSYADTLTLRLYGDGALVDTVTVTDDFVFRLGVTSRYKRWEMEIEGTDPVLDMQIAESVEELQ